MIKVTVEEAQKKNLIWLVKHHKKYCEGENCNISLIQIKFIAERAGLKFTKKEMELFW